MKSYLMNKNKIVAFIEFNEQSSSIDKIYKIENIDYAPLSLFNAYHDRSKNLVKELNAWFKGRGIPSWRKDVEKLIRNLGIHTTDELLNKAYALSLSDQYWLKEANSNLTWKDINFFEHDFEYKAFFDASINDSTLKNPNLKTPNNTTDGMLQKAWVIENGKRILVKGTYTLIGQEPSNEWLASQICSRLGFSYCPYQIDVMDNRIVSKCENFVSANQEIISAYDIFDLEKKSNSVNDYQHYLNILEKQKVPNAKAELENMIVLDYLTMNIDRHMKNFGVIRNVETLEWEKVTPLFDTGQCMNCSEITKNINFYDGKGKLFYNTEKKFSTYLSLISNFERFDLSKLDGLDKEYQTVLKKYQQFTDMSDDRIEKLVDGIRIRIKAFNAYKEKH